jgi:hypothetical protein
MLRYITMIVMASLCLATEPALGQERAAVLYASDEGQLYQVNPGTGALKTIASLHVESQFGPTIMTSIAYDAKAKSLYGMAKIYGDALPGNLSSAPYFNSVCQIDAQGARALEAQIAPFDPTIQLIAGPSGTTLYTIMPDAQGTVVSTVDATTGELAFLSRLFFGTGEDNFYFPDPRGSFWVYGRTSEPWGERDYLQQISSIDSRTLTMGKRLEGYRDTVPGGMNLNDAPVWPRYLSFSFQPYTRQLFATFSVAADSEGKPLPWQNDNPLAPAVFASVCTVDLNTGQPRRIIGTYKTGNGMLQITWAK